MGGQRRRYELDGFEGRTIGPHASPGPSPALPSPAMAGPSEQQERALRELLGLRTAPEWDPEVQRVDRALVEGRRLELTAVEYDRLLAPVVRLRLRRAVMHAL